MNEDQFRANEAASDRILVSNERRTTPTQEPPTKGKFFHFNLRDKEHPLTLPWPPPDVSA